MQCGEKTGFPGVALCGLFAWQASATLAYNFPVRRAQVLLRATRQTGLIRLEPYSL